METSDAETPELRASLKRLVLAADADRRRIERDLHQGAQQHLIWLAVKLQLLDEIVAADPAARTLVEELRRDVQQALKEIAQLAQRIYPPLLEQHDLGAALRAAAVTAGIPAVVDVAAGGTYPLEVMRTVYLCWVETLEQTGAGARPSITVRDEDGALTFEACCGRDASDDAALDRLRERVGALGGGLTIRSEADRGTCLSGSLPVDA